MNGEGSSGTGALPPGWTWAQVRDVGEIKLGRQRSPKDHQGPHMRPYLRVANVFEDRLDLTDVKEMNFTPAEFKVFRLEPSDILLNEGQSPHLVGRPAMWRGEIPGACFQNTLIRFRAHNGVVPGFALSVFRAQLHMLRYLRIATITTNIAHLSAGRFAAVEFPLPPTLEQQRIVVEIEKQFTRLDQAVATLEAVQAKLKRARASVLKAAVEGRLVPTESELARTESRNYESAPALLASVEAPPRPNRWESRAREVIPGHQALAVGNPMTALPDGWAWAQLADVGKMETGHTPSRLHPEWWQGDVPWIGIKDARACDGGTIHRTAQHTNEAGLANSAARLLPAGTVCLSRTASVGYVVVMGVPMATSQDFANWIPSRAITSRWLQLVLMADRQALLSFGKGSVHTTIYFPQLLAFHVAVPPMAEQIRIVAEVERRLSVLDALERTVEQNLARCGRLRQAILKRAFEGKLVPQDPADEPASELLARIRAQRAEVTA